MTINPYGVASGGRGWNYAQKNGKSNALIKKKKKGLSIQEGMEAKVIRKTRRQKKLPRQKIQGKREVIY